MQIFRTDSLDKTTRKLLRYNDSERKELVGKKLSSSEVCYTRDKTLKESVLPDCHAKETPCKTG